MIYSYEIDENCEYIPIHLNVVFKGKVLDYFNNLVDYKIAEKVYSQIRKKRKKYVVMDFDKIESLDSRVFHVFSTLIDDGYKFLFVNLNSRCMSILQKDELPDYVQDNPQLDNCLFSKGFCFTNDKELLDYCKQEKINNFTSGLIASYLYENRDDTGQQLESTNVEANMYIDVKSIFVKPNIYVYVIYKICSLIKRSYDIKEIDYLISSSNNGAILSILVGQLLNKKVINFVNLGPHLSLYNKDIINELEKYKNYLLVFDFICMGTEIKLAKTIIELKDANLIGAVGIAYYLKPNLNLNIDQVFYINDKNTKDFGYSISMGESLC